MLADVPHGHRQLSLTLHFIYGKIFMNEHIDNLQLRFQTGPSNLRIDGISASAVRMPLPRPVGASGTVLSSRDYLCLTLKFSDGSQGIGFSYIGTMGAETALKAIGELLAPVLFDAATNGGDPFSLQEKLIFATRIQGRAGILMNAISAIDIA